MLLLVKSRFGLLVFVRAVEDGAEETSVDGPRVHDDRVFLVVASVGQDGYYSIDTCIGGERERGGGGGGGGGEGGMEGRREGGREGVRWTGVRGF